ncbi:MAG TPA: MoxR family ATPase [Candidatus Limnocylindrales bacterium]|nr:MoxR family ATPase [Candidatus Limnocylindrales bacterium]
MSQPAQPGDAGRFASPSDVVDRLGGADYLADPAIGLTVFIADRLEKPVLLEGPAGVGKTELARSVATVTGARLMRLQCYEGLDESKALYEWNYKKQLLRIQADERREAWSELEEDIFSEAFLLARPLLAAIRADEPVVLLIDEIDRVEVEAEALMLEVLSDFQVTIPELGTMTAGRRPMVFLTSNDTRDLSEALRRRALYLRIEYPTIERERDILVARVPGLSVELADQVARIVAAIRRLDLKKPPSISEAIDWARTLVLLGAGSISREQTPETLHVLLKYEADIEKARVELAGGGAAPSGPRFVDDFRRPEGSG